MPQRSAPDNSSSGASLYRAVQSVEKLSVMQDWGGLLGRRIEASWLGHRQVGRWKDRPMEIWLKSSVGLRLLPGLLHSDSQHQLRVIR